MLCFGRAVSENTCRDRVGGSFQDATSSRGDDRIGDRPTEDAAAGRERVSQLVLRYPSRRPIDRPEGLLGVSGLAGAPCDRIAAKTATGAQRVPGLEIHLFGYPRLESDGADIPIRRRKALALVAYLATTETGHSRDALATLLWPEHDASRAYALLRNALWILNRTPLSDWLVATRHTIGFRKGAGLEVDVVSFRSALSDALAHDAPDSVERLAAAERIYRSNFLEGFGIDDSEPFDDWQCSESNALRRELAACLERLAAILESRGRVDDAIGFVRRWLEIEPLDESVHRRLMELLARSGRRAAAIAQFEACSAVLARELGLSPSSETARLVDRIRNVKIEPAFHAEPLSSIPVRLPSYGTPMVDRTGEAASVVELLRDSGCRLLTITGPGGCGKTRLAVTAASQAANAFSDGVIFVPLASVGSSSHVPFEIADAIGSSTLREQVADASSGSASRSVFDHLVDRLEDHRILLILDNMEHLLADLRWLPELLRRAPEIKILVTSRHQLELQDEWVFGIEGLPFPDSASASEDLADFGAVSLFLQSARRADAAFTPSERDWTAISQIVRLLEGMPLGIELAASWIRVMSSDTIASEIEKNLGFLAAKRRDVPKRHQSLRAAFNQSWRLLGGEARDAFRRASVFRGGFTAEAVEAVAGASLPVLSSLVTRSLLRRTSDDRYEMLEVLRQYAAERFRTMPDEANGVRDAHAAYYLDVLAEHEDALRRSGQRAAADRLTADKDNIRAAWHRAIECHRPDPIARGATGLFLLLDMRNHFEEGDELFAAAADALPSGETNESRLLYGFLRGLEAWFAHFFETHRSEARFGESLAVLEPLGIGYELAFVRLLWSFAGFGDPENRRRRLIESLAFFEKAGFVWEAAEACEALAWVLHKTDPVGAIEHARRSVAIHEELGDPWGIALARFTLGELYNTSGDSEEARSELEKSLALRRESGLDPTGALQCVIALGRVAERSEDWREATSRYTEALTLAEDRAVSRLLPGIHESLATALARANRQEAAAEHARTALRLYHDSGEIEGVERCESLIASLGCI